MPACVRTPVMAIAREAPFAGPRAGDRRRALRHHGRRLSPDRTTCPTMPTPTRRPISAARAKRKAPRGLRACSAATPPRHELEAWIERGAFFADLQLAGIERRSASSDRARGSLRRMRRSIGAGCGRFLAQRLAAQLGRPYRDFAEMIDCAPEAREMAARCAPAVAVACSRTSPAGRAKMQPAGLALSPGVRPLALDESVSRTNCPVHGIGAIAASCPLRAAGACATPSASSKATRTLLGEKHELVAVTRIRNEALILPDTLDYLGKHVDAIIAYDDASTDETVDMLREHPKVALIIANDAWEQDIDGATPRRGPPSRASAGSWRARRWSSTGCCASIPTSA